MKRSSKILVMLLALALSISCFAIAVSAADEESAYDYDKVLEYYEAGYYLNADFNGTDLTKDTVFADSNELTFEIPASTKIVANGEDVYFNATADTVITHDLQKESSFGINARMRLPKGAFIVQPAGTFILRILDSKGDTHNLFKVTPGSITIPVKSTDDAGNVTYPSTTFTTAITVNDYFDMQLFYDWSAGHGTIAITLENGTLEEYTFDLGYLNASKVQIMFTRSYFDYLEYYRGTFQRNLSDNDDDIAALVKDLVDHYEADTTATDAIKGLEVLAKVVGEYGFTTENVKDAALKADVDAAMLKGLKTIGDIYASSFIEGVAGLANANDYPSKSAIIVDLNKYDSLLKNIETNFADSITLTTSAADIAAAREVYAENKAWVDSAKANTVTALEAIANVPELFFASYADLRGFYDVFKNAPICETYVDDTYTADDIAEALKLAASYEAKYNELNNKAVAFVANVPVAADTTLTFAERYAAYILASENYFSDASYDAYLTDVSVADLAAKYAEVEAAFTPIINYAEDFISKVDEAKSSLSYSVKQVALDQAAVYLDTVEQQYPGVTEAIADYEATRADVSAKIAATEAYITAVIAVRDAADENAKLAAVDAAKALAENGSDVSVAVVVDGMSVTDANILLSTAEKEIESSGIRTVKFAEAVDAIAAADGMLAKRTAIFAAIELRAAADLEDETVKASNAKLEAAIADYNAAVAAANAVADEANNVATKVVEKTVLTKTTAEIVAIIKKYYEA